MKNTFPDLAIFTGAVSHCRRAPTCYRFRQPLLMLFVRAEKIAEAQKQIAPFARLGLLNFRRKDFLPGDGENDAVRKDNAVRKDLTDAALDALEKCAGVRASGPVYVLAQPRQFGVAYNPAAFYFICDGENEDAAYLLVEVHNTPWGERFCYAGEFAASKAGGGASFAAMQKHHRVSPFNPPKMTYEWRFAQPRQTFFINMKCTPAAPSAAAPPAPFIATLFLRRRPFSRAALFAAICRQPFSAALGLAAIYFHAFNLWRKKTAHYLGAAGGV